MSKKLQKLKAASIVKKSEFKGNPAYKLQFTPGLPYDEQTKGMPHKEAWCVETLIQGDEQEGFTAHTYLLFCSGDVQPNPTYIHYISGPGYGIRNIKKVCKDMGYDLSDAVEKSLEELRSSGLSKLTTAERTALGFK